MLDQSTLEQGYLEWNNNGNNESPQKYTLYNEDGAWTAVINVCGKAGRIEGKNRPSLYNEDGAWTAVINVCGKAGGIEGKNRPSKYVMSCRILESFPIPSLVVA